MSENNWVMGLPQEQRPQTMLDMVRMTAEHYNVPLPMAYAVFNQESSGVHQDDQGNVTTGPPNPTTAERAKGLFQVLPSTAQGYKLDPNDGLDNIETGIRYLREGLDANQGSTRGALAYYYGGPDPRQHGPFTKQYVEAVMPQILLQHQELERQAGRTQQALDAQKGKEGTIRPATAAETNRDWLVEHFPRTSNLVNTLLAGHDLRTREGRQNVAGTVGDIGGSFAGSRVGAASGAAAGTLAEPGAGTVGGMFAGAYSGRRVGGPVGAGLAGMAEQALEETGLPERATRALGYKGPPEPPPDPNATFLGLSGAPGRVLHAGYSQAWPAVTAQGVHMVVPAVAKRVVQSGIARGAAETFEKANLRDMSALTKRLDDLRTQAREMTVARNRGGRDLRQGITESLQDLRDQLDAQLKQTGLQGSREVTSAYNAARAEQRALRATRDTATQRLGTVKDVGARNVKAAAEAGEEELQLAKARADAAMTQDKGLLTAPPPGGVFAEPEAGEATVKAFQHAQETVLDPAGKAVEGASHAVQTPVDYRPLKAQAREMINRLMRPRDAAKLAAAAEEAGAPAATAQPFLTRDPATGELMQPAAPAAGAAVPVPKTNDDLDAVLAQIDDAQAAEIAKHPAVGLLRTIIDGPDFGPHILGHQWKSAMGQALEQSGAYGAVTNSVATNVTKKVTGTLRAALRDPGYDAATAAYDQLVPFFYKGPHAKLIAQIANREVGPEAIVQAIKPDQSTYTKQLVDGLLAHGGDAGKDAVARLQSAWWHRNVLQGGVENLADTVTKLENRPEFMKALFGDQAGKDLVANTKTVAGALRRKQAEWVASREAAEATKKTTVRGAEWRRDLDIQEAKELNEREIREATERVGRAEERVGQAREARGTAVEQQRGENLGDLRATERAGRRQVEAGRRVSEDERLAEAQTRQEHQAEMRERSQRTAEERHFKQSSLGSAGETTPGDMLGNLITTHVVPQLGFLKMLKGAKTDDILRYVVHSPTRTKAFVKALVAAPLHEPIPQITSAAIRSPGGVGAEATFLTHGTTPAERDRAEAERKARWNVATPPPPR